MMDDEDLMERLRVPRRILRQEDDIPNFASFDEAVRRFKDSTAEILTPMGDVEIRGITAANLHEIILGTTLALETAVGVLSQSLEDTEQDRNIDLYWERRNRERINRNYNFLLTQGNNAQLVTDHFFAEDDAEHPDDGAMSNSSMKLLSEAVRYLPSNKNPPPS